MDMGREGGVPWGSGFDGGGEGGGRPLGGGECGHGRRRRVWARAAAGRRLACALTGPNTWRSVPTPSTKPTPPTLFLGTGATVPTPSTKLTSYMSAAGAIDAHSLASVIVPSIFFIWSFVFISLIIFTSAQARNGNMMVSGMHSMRKMHVAREQRMMASVCTPRFRAGCISGGLADSQPMASDTSHHMTDA